MRRPVGWRMEDEGVGEVSPGPGLYAVEDSVPYICASHITPHNEPDQEVWYTEGNITKGTD
jgi:hypothetical protein